MFSPERILDYYGIYYVRAGSKLRINCPFHTEQNASCYIDKNFSWFCFGCARHGNLTDFLEQISSENKKKFAGLNSLQKMIECATILRKARAGNIAEYIKPACAEKKNVQEEKENRLKAWQHYTGLPAVDWGKPLKGEQGEAQEYILGRGFEPWLLNRSGCKYNYNSRYPLIWPIGDNGRFKGWVARTTAAGQEPKYLYNHGFFKRDCLAGLYGSSETVVVTEGLLDRLKLNQAGIVKDAVALLGWHMSEQQEQRLKSAGVKRIICALDNDDAGSRGLARLAESFDVLQWRYPIGVKDLGELSGEKLKAVCSTNLSLFAR